MRRDVKVGLVLGGGGAVGIAYHAAALAAIENDIGWDPRSAEVVVGTSAGSFVGAMLRRGLTGMDLAALTVGAPVAEVHRGMAEALADRAQLPAMSLSSLLRVRPPRLPVVSSWLRHPWRIDPVLALASLLPDGRVDLLAHVGDQSVALDGPWPEDALWVCAVRQNDLRRVVFGRDSSPVLSDAVAASCAIPGYIQPTAIDGEMFIDGGVRSPTNADVLRHHALDLAIIISPMSGQDLPRLHPLAAVRRYAKAKVDQEVRTLEAHGIPTLLIEPGAKTARVLGHDPMREDHLPAVVTAGLLDTGDQLRKPVARLMMHALSPPGYRSAAEPRTVELAAS